MKQLATTLQGMTPEEIQRVQVIESEMSQYPQLFIETTHTLHDYVYTRTIKIPAGVVITGALIKIPTTLILYGDVSVYVGGSTKRLQGYRVIPAPANRKQIFYAHEDTYLTMSFATSAKTVTEAEEEFTDETDKLLSRKPTYKGLLCQG